MNRIRFALLTASLFCTVLSVRSETSGPWTLFGLEGEAVNTIAHLSEDFGHDAIMAGTDNGIKYYEFGHHWNSLGYGCPVYDIKMIDDNTFVAAAGNGSDSEGIYMGKVTGIGEPGSIWDFRLLIKHSRPTALAVQMLDAEYFGGLAAYVLAGNVTGVSKGLLHNDSISALTAITGPENPFGMRCASILYSIQEDVIYAAGHGNYLSFSEEGTHDTAMLLRGTTELAALKTIDITSMVQYRYDNKTRIAMATVDSGIQGYIDGSSAFSHILADPQPNPLLAIATVFSRPTDSFPRLVAATYDKSVFMQCHVDMNCVWQYLPPLPSRPRCLSVSNNNTVWAGTDSGLYRYDLPVTTMRRYPSGRIAAKAPAVSVSHCKKGGVQFDIMESDTRNYRLSVFDLSGRVVFDNRSPGNRTLVTSRHGALLYRIMKNNRTIAQGRTMNFR